MTTEDLDSRQPKQLGDAQWSFVKKVRGAVQKDHIGFFNDHDWKNIVPSSGTYDSHLLNKGSKNTRSVQGFYVKPCALWAPHLLIDNHIPTCPRCESKEFVDPGRARFINSPIVLFGMDTNRYLDTFLYPCNKCSRTFSGYNKQSMKLDASVYYAYFDFYLGPGYAVDEILYKHIVEEAASSATAMIARRLKAQAYNRYYADYRRYLAALCIKKIQQPKKKQKTTMDQFLRKRSNDEVLERLIRTKRESQEECARARSAMDVARNELDKDVRFDGMLGDKDNHNIHGRFNTLSGLGSTKLRRLIGAGLYSMHELMAANSEDKNIVDAGLQSLLPGWQDKVVAYYDNLQREYSQQLERLTEGEELLSAAATELADYNESRLQGMIRRQEGSAINPYRRNRHEDSLPPLFTEFGDKKGYNGRVLSKFRIDSIVTNVFQARKVFQEAKMKGLCAAILKIDFNYKLVHKVRVWTKKGQSFVPFKCLVTIQNEDGLTVFWKALKHSESFTEIAEDMRRLRLRLNRNRAASISPVVVADDDLEESVKVIYVDNCCQVRQSVVLLFPGVLVKLDVFHWLKRWNDIIMDAGSAHAGIFRALMSRAIFNVESSEFERAKDKVQGKKKRVPTVKEIMKEANSVIPEPAILRSNVEAVLRYVQDKDAETEHTLSTWQDGVTPGNKPQRFLKPVGVRERIRKQLRHIDKGCLSDPPTDLVNIYRYNSTTDVCFVARGTNTNERDNFDLGNNILTATHIGIPRADRQINCFFEGKNCQKCITRLGDQDYGTHQTEQLLMINGCAKSAGFANDRLPFPNVSAPTRRNDDIKEYMGFQYCVPITDDVSNPTEDVNRNVVFDVDDHDDEEQEEPIVVDDGPSNTNQSTLGDDFDVEVLLTETGYLEPTSEEQREINEEIMRLEVNDAIEANDLHNSRFIQDELQKLLPSTTSKESTLQAFERLTEKNPWFPLRPPDSTSPATDIDKEEASYFANTSVQFQRHADLDSPHGYKAFEREWNNEVSRRFKEWTTGDEAIILLRLKKWEYLADYYDKVEGHKALLASLPNDDADRLRLRDTLRDNRRQLSIAPAALTVRPVVYRPDGITPFGAPTVLNSSIVVAAVTGVNGEAAGMLNGQVIAPYQVQRPLLLPPPPPRRQPVFRSRRYCIKCGWLRTRHVPEEGVAETCTRNFCGRCYHLKEHHPPNGFGKDCTYQVDPFCAFFVSEWFSVSYCYYYYCLP